MAQKTEKKRRPRVFLIILLILTAVLLLFSAAIVLLTPKSDPAAALDDELDGYLAYSRLEHPSAEPANAQAAALSCRIDGEELRFRRAYYTVTVNYLDVAAVTQGLEVEMQPLLEQMVADAHLPSEVFDESGAYTTEVLEKAYADAVSMRLSHSGDYMRAETVKLTMDYSRDGWQLRDSFVLERLFSVTQQQTPGLSEAAEKLTPVEFHYELDDWVSPGPEPDPTRFGATDDPAVITQLLETAEARKLINGQTLDWNPEKELIPDSLIRYYLDETILTIVWQESEHGAIGTFAETFIADASQLRRKLADDSPYCLSYYYPTELARQTNAVLALSGDFYDTPGRLYGVYAYNGQVLRSYLPAGETCYFNDSGDMLFSFPGQFADNEEAQAFLDDNRVMFSLSFGPVMISGGQDVTPYEYPLGEVLGYYARCAVGQLGRLHYLSMTINVRVPDYNVYITLRQAADSMLRHGCINAYTLDGGQTGSIILGGELINPVQFGVERRMSDIFYFATAIPRV